MGGTKMKKIICILSLATLFAAVSCQKSTLVENNGESRNLVPISFTTEITKTTVSVEGTVATVEWAVGDQVSIYYWSNDGTTAKTATLTAESAGASTTLSGLIEEGDNPEYFYATYPAGKGSLTKVETEDNFTIRITGGDGSFAKTNQMAAYTTAEAKSFQFKNAVGLIKVPVPTDGIISHGGKDYEIKGVRFKDINGGIPCTGESKVNVAGGVVTGYEAPGTYNSMATLSDEQIALGYAYIPVFGYTGGKTGDVEAGGFIIQYVSKDGEISAFGDIPAIITKDDAKFTINKGEIKELFNGKNPADYIVWDYYVSNDGTGDGKSESAPMSYDSFKALMDKVPSWCWSAALNGTVFHFKAETYNTYTAGEAIVIPAAGATFKTTFQGGWQGEEHSKTVWSGASGTSAKQHIFSCNNKIRLYVRDFTFEYGIAANGGAIDLGPTTAPQSDEEFLFDCKDCIFRKNTTSSGGAGGSVLVRSGAKGGVVRFDNCYFNGSKAAKYGITLASNGAASIYFNNCTLMEDLPNSICTYIYMNVGTGKLGMNNCTIKTDGSGSTTLVDKTRAMAVWNLGYTVIANSTFWTAKGFGDLGFAGFGCKKANEGSQNGSLYINCLFKNTCTAETPRYSFHLTGNYYQNIRSCWYNRINENDAVQDADYTLTNSWVYDVNSSLSDVKKNTHKINGVAGYNYTFSNCPAHADFAYETKADLKAAVKAVSVVGEPFNAWLEEIGAYDYDIAGAVRGDVLFPGSAQQTTTYND